MSNTNKQIARSINLLGKLLELHQDNAFKIRSYYSAYNTLRRIEQPFEEMEDSELLALPGIGKTIVDKIRELQSTGTLKALEKVKSITPEGVIQMLSIRGIGPKKVYTIWKDMLIESPGELLLACNENRLVKFKGFGLKTQLEIAKNLEYFMDSQGKYHYANVEGEAHELLALMSTKYPNYRHALVGDVARMMPEVKGIEILSTCPENSISDESLFVDEENNMLQYKEYPVHLYHCQENDFGTHFFEKTSSDTFQNAVNFDNSKAFADEESLLEHLDIVAIPYEYREQEQAAKIAKSKQPVDLIAVSDIKGIVHNHSTYSDGLHSIEDMAKRCRERGYDYFVISDHSKSAGYAGGLSEERVMMQWREVDALNQKSKDFKIYKSIESDILTDGSLDYDEDILKGFDIVIASIHSVLNMDEATATARLIKAIENPYTRILGHPTGRLLLGRKGYPIDYAKVIDAAAANNVSIEINANPQRLDLDWTWIPYAISKDVLISINPDAHSMDQIDYVKYGVAAARKGGLTKEHCLNSMTISQFDEWIAS